MIFAGLLAAACALPRPAAAQTAADAAGAESLAGAALTLDSEGRSDAALPFWDQAVAALPRDAALREERAWSLAAAGHIQEALAGFDQAIALSSAAPSWTALLGSGAEEFLAGRSAAAQARLHEAMMAAPLEAAAPFLSGRLSEASGTRNAALAYYRSAYQDDPEQPEAEAALARLLARFDQPRAALGYALSLSDQDPGDKRADALARTLRRGLGGEGEPPGPRRLDELLVRSPGRAPRGPRIDVALVSDAAGKAASVGAFIWTCNSDFTLRGASGTVVASGHAFDPWGVEYDTAASTLRIGPLGAPPPYRAAPPLNLGAARSGADFLLQDLRAPAAPGRDVGDREVRGGLTLEPASGGVRLILHSALEDYVRDRLSAAAPSGESEAGLGALAVLLRTRALIAKQKSSGPVCDSGACGLFSGVQDEYPLADRAAARTAGYVLRQGRALLAAADQRSCGGVSEPGPNGPVWDMPPLALRSPWALERFLVGPAPKRLLDASRVEAPNADARWSRVLDAGEVEARLRRMGFKGRLHALVAGARDPSGRLLSLAALGRGKPMILDAAGMARALSPGTLRSTFFVLKTLRERGRPALFLLFGAGTGDGVGFCRAGADGLAASGQDFRRILRHYFPKAKLARLYR